MGFCKVGKLFDFPTQKYLPVYLYLAVTSLQSTSLELNLMFEVRKSSETKRKIAISNQNSNLGLLTLWACALPLSYRTRQEASEIKKIKFEFKCYVVVLFDYLCTTE